MSTSSLFDPVIEGGVRQPNWFEGRLLTAQAMRERDLAERQRERLLGRAIGSGVIEGLWVTRGAAIGDGTFRTLSIAKGSALTEGGDSLVLGRDITVDVIPPGSNAAASPGLFGRCGTPPSVPTIPSGFGIYVLVMSPATAYRERAPKRGLGTEGLVTGCGNAFIDEGVRFRLEKLEPNNISGISAAERSELNSLIAASDAEINRSLLRNLIAHHCFGTSELIQFTADPLARSGGVSQWFEMGAVDDLRALGRLSCCDVPIALMLWNIQGIAFIDVWSVRTPPLAKPTSTAGPLWSGARQPVLAAARLNQFQAQLQDIADTSSAPSSIEAAAMFRYLPPVGFVPLLRTTSERAFDHLRFFNGRTARSVVHINGARLIHLVRESFDHAAIDLRDPTDRPGSQFIWRYLVRENGAALDGLFPAGAQQRILVFSSGHMPFYGEARFDTARWNYSNYTSRNV